VRVWFEFVMSPFGLSWFSLVREHATENSKDEAGRTGRPIRVEKQRAAIPGAFSTSCFLQTGLEENEEQQRDFQEQYGLER
jgi:hypothetical protein